MCFILTPLSAGVKNKHLLAQSLNECIERYGREDVEVHVGVMCRLTFESASGIDDRRGLLHSGVTIIDPDLLVERAAVLTVELLPEVGRDNMSLNEGSFPVTGLRSHPF